MPTYRFKALFTRNGSGVAPSSAPTVTIVDTSNNILVSAAATTALSNLTGVYIYSYTGTAADCIAKFTTSDVTVDSPDVVDYTPQVITDYIDAAISTRATPADVTVTASVAVSATTAATVSTGNLALSTSYTLRQSVSSTVTDNLSTATKLWLSIKASASDTDAQSLIFVEKTAGLTVVNGATYATTGNGSLTVSGSSGAWSVAIHVDEAATALLVGRNGRYIAAVKALVGTDTVSVWEGGCVITDGIVRAYA